MLSPTGVLYVLVSLLEQVTDNDRRWRRPSIEQARTSLRINDSLQGVAYQVHAVNWLLTAIPWSGAVIAIYNVTTWLSAVVFGVLFSLPFIACAWYYLRSWLVNQTANGSINTLVNDAAVLVIAFTLLSSHLTWSESEWDTRVSPSAACWAITTAGSGLPSDSSNASSR